MSSKENSKEFFTDIEFLDESFASKLLKYFIREGLLRVLETGTMVLLEIEL